MVGAASLGFFFPGRIPMSTKSGNWFPVDRNLIHSLSPTSSDPGQYSEWSAYLSLRDDLEEGNPKGLREYARIWKWSPKKALTFFNKIGYQTGETLDDLRKHFGNRAETRCSIIFTDLDDNEETERKHSGNTTLKTKTKNKSLKTKTKTKTYAGIFIPARFETPEFLEIWKEFKEHRKKIGYPMTDLAQKKMLSRLEAIAGDDVGLAVSMLEQSIINGWQGVFEIKKGSVGGNGKLNLGSW